MTLISLDSSQIVAALIGAAAAIAVAFIPSLLRLSSGRSKIRIRRIDNAQDKYLRPALEVYERIPENERDAPDDIVRWIEEVRQETSEGRCKLRDYFLAAVANNQVAGMLYAHYYPASRFLFISSLAANDKLPEGQRSSAVFALLRWLSREVRSSIQGCRGIVFEHQYASAGDAPAWLECATFAR